MIKQYYGGRLDIWLDYQLSKGHAASFSTAANSPLQHRLSEFADTWNNATWSDGDLDLPAEPRGDPVATARAMLAKYPGL